MDDPNDDIGDTLKSLGEYDESKEYKAPWDWHDLPIIRGDPKFDRITTGDTLIVELLTGRKLRLGVLHQFATHSGMLLGMPQVRDHFVEQALNAAQSIFGETGNR